MRDRRFVAEHRGGSLTKDHHHQLIRWARGCSGHVLTLVKGTIDPRLIYALHIAQQWEQEEATVGEARKASVNAHAVARECEDPILKAVARSVGHAVATAHMADHSIGAALYGLQAIKHAGKSINSERKWQTEQLPAEIRELVITAIREKEKHFRF